MIEIIPVVRNCVCRSCSKTMTPKKPEMMAWCHHWVSRGTTVILCMNCVDELVKLREDMNADS